ncbi:hypothetical protein [Halolamina salifodinae]|uniref:Flagellar biosynthesis protein FlhB n=1 Tax=Halolamina salifodinae TaxID=1202767 RepID=A0A8T4GSY5_9EURY|nr:hypothetical protein [Halolamina salifodinae]MBP1986201.1 flagellar biosynthesis protein FlhB [Halolamina salifodinae]
MSVGEAIELVKMAAKVLVLLILAISVLPPLIMYLITGDLDYWTDAFVGAIVPWWVGLPGTIIVVVVLLLAAMGLEDLL